jgi:antitoxin CptB
VIPTFSRQYRTKSGAQDADILVFDRYITLPGTSGLFVLGTMSGTTISSEGLDARRRRLLFRAWHRGTREVDLITGRFADAHIANLNESEVDDFERLMDVPEPDLLAWVMGVADTPEPYDTALFRKMRAFNGGAR